MPCYRFNTRRGMHLLIGKRFLFEWTLIGAISIAVVVYDVVTPVTERASYLFYDQLLLHSKRAATSNIVIVAIDDESIAELGRWPWPRDMHAALLRQIAKARPRAVAYDVLFTESSPGDAALAEAMKTVPTYLPLLIDRQPVNQSAPAVVDPVPALRDGAAGMGHIDLDVDHDGIVRSVSLLEGSVRNWALALMVPVFRSVRGAHAPLPGMHATDAALGDDFNRAHRMMIPFSRASIEYPHVSFASVMLGQVPAEVFTGKIVLVGATAAGLRDRFATPMSGAVGELPGVDIHATILNALLDGLAIEPVNMELAAWMSVVPALLLLGGLLVISPLQSLVLTITLALACVASSAALMYGCSCWISPVPMIEGLALIYLLWSWRRLEVAMSYFGEELRLLAAEPDLLPGHNRIIKPASGDMLERLIGLTRNAVHRQRNMRQFVWESLNSLPEPIVVCNHEGRILMGNKKAHLHHTMADFTGMSIMDIFSIFHFVRPVNDCNSEFLWPAVLDPRVPKHLEVMTRGIEVRDRQGRDHMLRYAPCVISMDTLPGWIASWVDVTALHAAERQRADLLHFLSHDMRSPQASILALIDTERSHLDSPRASKLIARVERYARRSLALADDFVQLARAESQQYQLEVLDLYELAIDASDEVWPLANAKQIDVRCSCDGESFWVHVDGSLMTRALINLLSNAIKYSPTGTRVDCIVSRASDSVVCMIRDQGYGIALRHQTHLFERFRRFHFDGDQASDGTGLGMAFVKAVINRHSGDIAIKSALNAGTTVTLTLHAQRFNQ